MKNCTRPVTVSDSASGIPLKGTCTTSIFARAFRISAAKCVPLPTPAEEKFSVPGFVFAVSRRSFRELQPSEGETTSTYFETPVSVIPVNSLESYGSLL